MFQAGIDTPGAWAAVSKTNLVLSYDASNTSSYPGSGTALTDISGGGRNATLQGGVTYSSAALNFTTAANGSGSYGTINGDLKGFDAGLTVSFEGTLGSGADSFERIISVGNLAVNGNGIYGSGGDGFWVGRYWTTSELAIEGFNGGVSTGQCRTSGAAADSSYARWTFTISSAKVCRIYKNGVEQLVNNTGGANAYGVSTNVAMTSLSHTVNYLGRSHWTADPDLGGGIRWIKVYAATLSQAEITDEQTGVVTFDANQGSGSMSNQSSSAAATLTSNAFTRTGYTFAGWNTQAGGGGTSYANAATYSFSDDITLYAQWTLNAPTVTTAPSVAGTAKAGQTLTATAGVYVAGGSPTTVSKWQRSADNSWSSPTDISGATGSTYTLVDADAGNYIRYVQTVTNSVGSVTSNSAATTMVLSSNSQTTGSGGSNAVTDLITAVPNDSNVYNVSIVSSNLATGKLKWSSVPTGLTGIRGADPGTTGYLSSDGTNGWATSGFPTIHFRGTGADIRTALATLGYTSTTVGTDALKIYVNSGSTTSYDVKNYIPIFDNGKLTFHYYTFQTQTAQSSSSTQTTLQATTTLDGVSSPNKWYLMTPRYWIEDDRGWQLTNISSRYSDQTFLGGYADAGSNVFYYPAGTDGWASRTDYYNSSTLTPLNSMFSGWYSTSWFDNSLNALRETHYICGGACTTTQSGNFGWDDYSNATNLRGQYIAETYSTTPLAMATTASAAQTVRTITPPSAPTSLAVTASSTTAVNLTWTAAGAGTDALTDYQVQWSTSSTFASNVNTVSRTASTTATQAITGLSSNTSYYFRVAAISSVTGAYSTIVNATTPNADAPSVSAVAAGWISASDTSVALNWAAPTAYNSATISGYTIQYSTNQSSWSTFARTGAATSTYELVTGLTANTLYYFKVTATLSSGTGLSSTMVSATTNSAATSISVVASGGGTSGTNYTVANGLVAPLGAASVSINEADLESLFATNANVRLLADTVTVTSPITWSANSTLQLGNRGSSRVAINADLTAIGTSAGVVISPSACAYSAAGSYTGCYSIDVKNGANITLSGVTSTLSIGGTAYTLLRSQAEINAVSSANAGGSFAIANPVSLTTSYSAPVWNFSFTGLVDGLGNSIDGLTMTSSTMGFGLVGTLYGGTVRNLGLTGIAFSLSQIGNTAATGAGAVAAYVAGSTTIDQVWSTGSLRAALGNYGAISAGGLVGNVYGGALAMSRSWSSVSVDTSATGTTANVQIGSKTSSTGPCLSTGGLIGSNVAAWCDQTTASGTLTLNEVYSTGSVKRGPDTNWRGTGGLLGLANESSATTITDAFSWGTVSASDGSTVNLGGLVGYRGNLTLVRTYTSSSTCAMNGAYSGCTPNMKPGATLASTSVAAWGSTTGSVLTNLAAPAVPLYVVPVMNTTNTVSYTGSSFGAVTYKVVDGSGTDLTANFGTAGYPSFSGAPAWDTISASTAAGSYSVKYTSGLSLSGTAAANYSISPLGTGTTIALTYATVSSPPTGVTVTGSGQNNAVVGWVAPASPGSGGVTGYRMWYSTNSNMTSASSVDTNSARTYVLLTGLAANTTYYVKVQALGAAWVSDFSTVANGATKTAATTLTVVASGGGAAGTNFVTVGGAVTPVIGNTSASINASDLQTLLAAGDAILAADTVTVSSAVSWSASTKLALGNSTSSTVAINADLSAIGTSAGLVISTDACVYGGATTCYSIDTKNGANVTLSGATSTLTIAGGGYTLLRSQAEINAVSSTNPGAWYALARPITMSTSYTVSPFNFTYTGKFDGLGNTVSGLTITPSATGEFGFFSSLNAATVRNVGFTNANLSSSAAVNMRIGAVAGNASNAASTTTISQVWATGFNKLSATTGCEEAGGLFGGATAGTLNISKSWSSVTVSTAANCVADGGIIGATASTYQQSNPGTGTTLVVDESYSTGNILRDMTQSPAWYGTGGIIGVSWGPTTTLRNVFSWGNINSTASGNGASSAGISTAGISGVGTVTISNAYTSHPTSCGAGTITNCLVNQTPGTAVSGFSSGLWSTTNGASLVNLPAPTKNLYVKVVAPTDGSFGTMSYQVVDSTGTVQTLSSLGLTVSNSPVYTIDGSTVKGTYSVNYVSGLTLGGANAGVYSLSAWINTTPVTITKYNQTVTWAPTTSIPFGPGTATPSASPSSTATPTTTFSFAVTSAGTTGCTVNGSGVLSYTGSGTCVVTVTGAASGDYLAGSTAVSFVIGAPIASVTIVPTSGAATDAGVTFSGGRLVAASGANVTVNEADVEAALATGSLVIPAQSVTVNGPINWSASSVLTLGLATNSTVNVNASIAASGATAGLDIKAASYGLATKSGASISLTGASSTLSIGGNAYTLVRSAAGFSSVTATAGTYWALAQPVAFSAARTASPVDLNFTGTFDGLGNTVSGLSFSGVATSNYLALFKLANGATFRNLGVIGLSNTMTAVASGSYGVGALVGATQTGTTTMTQVWSTGLIQPTSTNAFAGLAAGGLVGLSNAGGTLNVSKSWSSVSINASAATISYQAFGGIVGGDFDSFNQLNTSSGGSILLSEVYATGPISGPAYSWAGLGGLIGLHWSSGVTTSITDGFSWSSVTSPTTTSMGGVLGQSGGTAASLSNTYTTRPYCYYTITTYTGCTKGITAGQTSGVSGANWGSTNGSSLVNLPAPLIPLFVKPKFSGTTGSTLDFGYDIVDGSSTVSTPANVSVGGTVAYAPASMPVSATPYSVYYDSGLSLSGTSAGLYSLAAWPTALSATISRNVITLSWNPTRALTRLDTNSTLAAPTTNSTATPTYSVVSAGTTSCAITSARVITFSAAGTCRVKADYAQNTLYTASSATVDIIVSNAAPLAPTGLTVTGGGSDAGIAVSWTAPSTTTTGGTISSYTVEYSSDSGSTWTTVTGITGTSTTLTGLTNGTGYLVRVKAINATDSLDGAYVTSPSATTAYWLPANTSAPTITGSAVGGLVLTAADGTWTDGGKAVTATTYQWQRSTDGSTWTNISGATASTYTVDATNDTGKVLRVVVSKTNGSNSLAYVAANSTATATVTSGLAAAATLGSIDRGNTQITVNWAAPTALNGGTISAYKVQYRAGTTGAWTTASSSVSASATSYVITGLTNGTGYTVQVTAVTAAGDGSGAASSSTTTPATVPSNSTVPTTSGTAAVGRALTSTNGNWSTGGDAVTYTYQWQSAATSGGSYTAISGATSSTYTPVTADVGSYLEVVVTATNTVGAASATSAATLVVQTGLAAAPTALTPTASNGQLVLSWTAPTTLNGGVISDYSVSYKKSTDSTWTTVTVGSTTASQTITGLTNATAYDWSVAAVTAAGTGAVASYTASLASTPFTTPSNTAVPTIASPAVSVANTLTAGTWTDNGRTSTLTYQWEISTDGSTWSNISGATAASYTPVSGDSGKYLRVKEIATNAAGATNAWSASLVVQTGLASAPQNLVVARDNGKLNLSWTAPAALNGGVISSYEIHYKRTVDSSWQIGASGLSPTATSGSVTLVNGTAYDVRVLAKTAAGANAFAVGQGTPLTVPSNSGGANLPSISGTVAAGRVLTATDGTWATGGAAVSYSYQWQSATTSTGTYTDIAGATASSYTPVGADVGSYLKVVVTATNVAGSTLATSAATVVVQSGVADAPTGLGVAFSTSPSMRLNVGWTAPTGLNGASVITNYVVEYAVHGSGSWSVASNTVAANASSYAIASGLTAGTSYDVRVAALTTAGTGAYVSNTSGTLYAGVPVSTVAPVISGSVGVGETLSVTDGSWDDRGLVISGYSYQWQSSGDNVTYTDISGATASSYTLQSADSGQYVRAVVSATNAVGAGTAEVVANGPGVGGVVGTAVASAPRSVTATAGDQQIVVHWTAPLTMNGGVHTGYRVEVQPSGGSWIAAPNVLGTSATSATVSGLTNATAYAVRVLALTTLDGATGAASGSVTPFGLPINSALPVLSGSNAINENLAVSTGSWSGNGAAIDSSTGYSYQWLHSTDGTSFTPISGETHSTFSPQSGSAGEHLAVEVTATNAAGSTTVTVQAGQTDTAVPGQVTGITVTPGDEQLAVSWTAPTANHGGTITNYEVWTSTDNGQNWAQVNRVTSNATNQTITGLSNGVAYQLKIAAITRAAIGASVTRTADADSTPFGAPISTAVPTISKPTGFAVGETLTAVAGSWNTNGRSITGTSYQWQWLDGSTWTNISGASTASYVVALAMLGKSLRVVETSTNTAGPSSANSIASTAVTSAVADAPTNLAVVAGDQSLAVTWTDSTDSHGGTLTGVDIETSLNGSTWSLAGTVNVGVEAFTVTGLTNGSAYSVRVSAHTANVMGNHEVTTATSTPFGTPIYSQLPVVSNARVSQTGASSTGSWNANGATVSGSYGYLWQYSTDNGGTWTNYSGSTASHAFTFADLGRQVRVIVTASNAAGQTTATSAAVTVDVGNPTAPTGLLVTPGAASGQLDVQWVAPDLSQIGGSIASYTVEVQDATGNTWTTVSSSVSASATSFSVTGLTNATAYFVRVRGSNGYDGAWVSSTASATPYWTPINTGLPSVGGSLIVDGSATAADGTWNSNGDSISGTSYQWERSANGTSGWTTIAGATAASYAPTNADFGKRLRVIVSQSNQAGTVSATSAASAAITEGVPDAPSSLQVTSDDQSLHVTWAQPNLREGTLSCYVVEYSDDNAATWQPFSRGSPTATTETITGLTNGTGVIVRVRADSSLQGAWATSSSVVPVGLPQVSAVPSVTGTAQVGHAITSATTGTWSANGGTLSAATLQWQSSADGTNFSTIAGATSSSYTLAVGDYGHYLRLAVTRSNSAGSTTSFSTPTAAALPDVADAPTNLQISRGDHSLTLSWTAPSAAGLYGGSISDYTVEVSGDNGTNWTPIVHTASTATSRSISNLTVGTSYLMRVRAQTGVDGSWAYSAPVLAIGAPTSSAQATLSGRPLLGDALSVGTGGWTTNGAAVSSYRYQWQRSTDGVNSWTDVTGASNASMTIAIANVYYRALVWATNEAGESTGSASSTVSPFTVSQVPNAPTNLTVTPGDQQLSVSWTTPSQLGGGTVTDYDVATSTDGQIWNAASHSASSATSLVITGLTNGTEYYVRVAGITTVLGNYANSGDRTIPYGHPINISSPTVYGSQIAFGKTLYETGDTWADNGNPLAGTSYQWQASADNGSTWTNIAGATSSSYVIGEYVGKKLRVSVTRSNTAGLTTTVDSAATSTVAAVAASQPRAVTLTPGDHQVIASWTAPASLGGSALTGYVVEWSTDQNTWTTVTRSVATATSETITGLSNGTPVSVRVHATTSLTGALGYSAAPATPFGLPINTAAPLVSGTVQFDETLTAAAGSWDSNGSNITSTSYQWQANTGSGWSNIAGATNASYVVGSYVGATIRVRVTSHNSAGDTVADSTATGSVSAAPAGAPTGVTVTPGDQQLGVTWTAPGYLGGAAISDYEVQTSTDNGGSWTGVSRTASATASQTISSLSNGTGYLVRVRALNGVTGGWVTSSQTVPYGHPVNTALPVISGTAQFDQPISATPGSWNANGRSITAMSYQWQQLDGSTWTNIAGATSANYTVGLYVGRTLRVVVTTTNLAGQTSQASVATSAVLPAAPNAPTGLTVTPSDQQLTVSWTAPTYIGGAALSDYLVQTSTDGSSWTSFSHTASTATNQTVTGLSNGTAYYVRVQAFNGANGDWVTSSSTSTPYGVPIGTAVPGISGTAKYDQPLSASAGGWTDNGRSISATTYQWQVNSGSGWTNIVGATNANYTVGNYVGANLRVQVTAQNLAGSTTQTSIATTTVVASAPGAPQGLTLTPGDQQLNLSWTAPSYLGGAAITDYTVEISTDGSTWQSVGRSASPTASQLVTGLSNGTDYYARVRALNGANGTWTISANPTMPRGLPINVNAPSLSGTTTYGQQLSVTTGTWDANGSALTQTTMQWQSSSDGGTTWTNISGATNASYTIGTLVGQRVRSVITVTNAAGSSSQPSTASTVIAPAAPSAPRSLSLTEQDHALSLSWLVPTSTGGVSITDYEVQISTDGNTWTTVPRTSSTTAAQAITGLSNGSAYYLRVRALNGANGAWAFVSDPAIPRGLPVNVTAPSVNGIARFNSTVSANDGVWNDNGDSISGTSYQWQASNDNGSTWSNIPAATSANYMVGLYVGSTLRVVVTVTNEAGSSTLASAATATVIAIPAATPVITSQSVGNGQITLGWTPPIHSGGVDLVGYTLQVSTDQANWTTISTAANVTSTTIAQLANGTGYYARVRAQTDRDGDWSPIAGPFTPVAPPAPRVVVAPVAPVFDPSVLLTRVMPVLNSTSSITSLTGAPAVTITNDGRIELTPAQSVALKNGQPMQADVSVTGNTVVVQTDTVQLSVAFGAASASGDSVVTAGTTATLAGGGFAPTSPVVSWIQSTPTKLAEAYTDAAGAVNSNFAIPTSIAAGAHTIQINGIDTEGNVVSIIYGVQVQAADPKVMAMDGHLAEPGALAGALIVLWTLGMLLLLALILISVVRRRVRD